MATKSSQPLIVDITDDEPLPSFASFLREGEEDFSKWDREHVSLVIQVPFLTVERQPQKRLSFCDQTIWCHELNTSTVQVNKLVTHCNLVGVPEATEHGKTPSKKKNFVSVLSACLDS